MNAVLHRKAEITIKSGNTFSNPLYLDKKDNSVLERFDYIVANLLSVIDVGTLGSTEVDQIPLSA